MEPSSRENRNPEPGDEILEALGLASLVVYFQPILSLKSKAVVGYEGLIRGIRGEDEVVPAGDVLRSAKAKNMVVEMDRLCRATVLNAFSSIREADRSDRLLFLNFESSLLNTVESGSGYFLRQVAEAGLNPSDIAIELIESKVNSPVSLNKFVGFHRRHGFVIALDDVGVGYSNFDRIPHIKPDIIKVDRSIVEGIERDYYQQEVLRSLRNLSRKIGALLLAEGVETDEEALCVMELDADLVQGYCFAKPQPFREHIDRAPQDAATRLRTSFRSKKVREIQESKRRHSLYDEIANQVWSELQNKSPDEFDATLGGLIDSFAQIEALYVLDAKGVQVSDTILNSAARPRLSGIFHGANKGDDLSLKEYFYLLVDTGMRKYTTDSYISLATGNLIRTLTTTFTAADSDTYVLCLDVVYQD
jgi:EAL domain-containing protein (putative c-di-GMP-specific phosphodiesterase class I)